MLPGLACFTGQHVPRARLEQNLPGSPLLAAAALKAQTRAAQQRDSDDDAERRRVAMPADRRPRRVPLNENLHQLVGSDAGKLAGDLPSGFEPVGDRLTGLRRARLVVVRQAEMARRPPRRLAADDDRIPPQLVELLDQPALVLGCDDLRLEKEAVGSFGGAGARDWHGPMLRRGLHAPAPAPDEDH